MNCKRLIYFLIAVLFYPAISYAGFKTNDSIITDTPWVDACSYTNPDDAITAIGTKNRTLLVIDTEICDTSFTIPANIKVKFERNGKWTINNGVTVTFKGQMSAELCQIFNCVDDGKVIFGDRSVKEVYPQWFGACGNGIADDTAAINAAIQAAHDSMALGSGISDVRIPSGTYQINGNKNNVNANQTSAEKGIVVLSNTNLILDQNAVLRAITCDTGTYDIIQIVGRSNVTVKGGSVIGERNTHIVSGGESGFGIDIRGSSNVLIDGVRISDCWGDGIITGGVYANNGHDASGDTNIVIQNCISDNNRRQGLSICGGANIRVINNTFSNTNGTAPEAGIDIEPDSGYNAIDILIEGNKIFGNTGHGITAFTSNEEIHNLIIRNNFVSTNTVNGISCDSGTVRTKTSGILISGNVSYSNAGAGIVVNVNAPTITGNIAYLNGVAGIELYHTDTGLVQGNHCYNNGKRGIELVASNYNVILGNVCDGNATDTSLSTHQANIGIYGTSSFNNIQNNTCLKGSNTHPPLYGIHINNDGNDGNLITNNYCKGGGSISGIRNEQGAGEHFGAGNIINDGTWKDTGD